MKIGSSSSPAADAAALARANAEAGSAAKARAQVEAGSSVQLSGAAAGLLAAGATPEFDAAIADKLIANAQEVLGAARR